MFNIIVFCFVNLLCLYVLWEIKQYYLTLETVSDNINYLIDKVVSMLKYLSAIKSSKKWYKILSKYKGSFIYVILYAGFGLLKLIPYFMKSLKTYLHCR